MQKSLLQKSTQCRVVHAEIHIAPHRGTGATAPLSELYTRDLPTDQKACKFKGTHIYFQHKPPLSMDWVIA